MAGLDIKQILVKLIQKATFQKMSRHMGGGEGLKYAKIVSRIIWMAPYYGFEKDSKWPLSYIPRISFGVWQTVSYYFFACFSSSATERYLYDSCFLFLAWSHSYLMFYNFLALSFFYDFFRCVSSQFLLLCQIDHKKNILASEVVKSDQKIIITLL